VCAFKSPVAELAATTAYENAALCSPFHTSLKATQEKSLAVVVSVNDASALIL